MIQTFRYKLGRVSAVLAAILCLCPVTAYGEGKVEISGQATNGQPRVSVSVSATDEKGLPILGLTPRDVTVTENGVPQTDVVLYPFYERPTPIDAVLALDASGDMNGQPFEDVKVAANAFVNGLGLNDQVGVVSFGFAAKLEHPLTSDTKSIRKAIESIKLTRNTALNDALVVATKEARRSKNVPVVILMTNGVNWKSKLTQAQALEQVLPLKVPVFTVAFGNTVGEKPLQDFARLTGGRYYSALNGSQLAEVFESISQQLHQEYRLSYKSSTVGTPGDKVDVQISINKGSFAAAQRFSYSYAARESARAAGVPVSTGNLAVVTEGKPAQQPAPMPLNGYGLPLVAGLAALALASGGWLASTQSTVQRRMETYVSALALGTGSTARRRSSPLGKLARPIISFTSSVLLRVLPGKHQRQLADNLAAAGHPYRWRLAQFVTLKAFAGLVPAALILLVSGQMFLAFTVLMLGFYAPNFWLARKVKQRRSKIRLQMPDALDLLTIGVGAGLGFDAAMQEVVHKWDNEIAQEFNAVLAEMKLGKTRRDALRAMGKRVDIQEMKLFVGAIVQAEEIGMGIGRALTIQAEQMRLRRRQKAEEMAHKAVIKMIMPMVFFIFPAIFIVLLGPAAMSIAKSFAGMMK